MSDASTPNGLTYAQAGVDIDAAARLIDRIKPLAASTRRPGADASLGGFGAVFDLKAAGYSDPVLVSSTDGVGTKVDLAVSLNRHDTIGVDLVAMCVNDALAQGAEPLFFLDYLATGKLSLSVAESVVAGIAEGCRQAGCALIGGETAEMPGMYDEGRYDLAGFVVGAAERDHLLPDHTAIQAGDLLVAVASSGPHSNGYSLIRKIAARAGLAWDAAAPWDAALTLGEALLTPTRIYVKSVLPLIRAGHIHGLAHITGGGLTENAPRMLPDGFAISLDYASWPRPGVFSWLQSAGGVEEDEMRRAFNCGIGLVLAVSADKAGEIMATLEAHGEAAWACGEIVEADA